VVPNRHIDENKQMIDYKINIDEINKSQGLDLFNLIGKEKGNETKHV